MKLAPQSTIDLLQAIAARADNEHVTVLTPAEIEFAMTLAGRRLLQCIHLDATEFRLSAVARDMLAEHQRVVGRDGRLESPNADPQTGT